MFGYGGTVFGLTEEPIRWNELYQASYDIPESSTGIPRTYKVTREGASVSRAHLSVLALLWSASRLMTRNDARQKLRDILAPSGYGRSTQPSHFPAQSDRRYRST